LENEKRFNKDFPLLRLNPEAGFVFIL
jgi:hypothetical protein